jgi:hypothetical protein
MEEAMTNDLGEKFDSAISDAALARVGSLAKQLGAKVAFALPPPFGPEGPLPIATLFGLATAQDPGVDAAAIQSMLTGAINDLKQFIQDLKLDEKDEDVTDFFQWFKEKVQQHAAKGSLENAELSDLIDGLEKWIGYDRGKLSSDLVRVANNDAYVRRNEHIERREDRALSFIILDLTAQFVARKLISMLSAQIAADLFTAGLSAENEEDYNTRLKRANTAVEELSSFINGSTFLQAAPWYEDYLAEMRRNLEEQRQLVASGAYPTTASDLRPRIEAAAFGTIEKMSEIASDHGWKAAIERLIALRKTKRLQEIGRVMIDGPGGMEYYSFRDGSYYFRDEDFWTVAKAWAENLDRRAEVIGAEYKQDSDILRDWSMRVIEMTEKLPPNSPGANTMMDITESGWAHDAPPANSPWAKATGVRYAFSFRNANGAGARTPWSKWQVLNPTSAPRWKPTLENIPKTTDFRIQEVLVWRQFEGASQRIDAVDHGDPKIVGRFAPTTRPGRRSAEVGPPALPVTRYIDNDAGLT